MTQDMTAKSNQEWGTQICSILYCENCFQFSVKLSNTKANFKAQTPHTARERCSVCHAPGRDPCTSPQTVGYSFQPCWTNFTLPPHLTQPLAPAPAPHCNSKDTCPQGKQESPVKTMKANSRQHLPHPQEFRVPHSSPRRSKQSRFSSLHHHQGRAGEEGTKDRRGGSHPSPHLHLQTHSCFRNTQDARSRFPCIPDPH